MQHHTPNLSRLHQALCKAEQPLDPPLADDATYYRNVRNSCRVEAIGALDKAISRLDELDHDGRERGTQLYLENLREYLVNDMEQVTF